MTESQGLQQESTNGQKYETVDANVKSLTWWGIGLFALTAVVLVLMLLLIELFESRQTKTEIAPHPLAAEVQQPPPTPRLQITPTHDLGEFRALEDSLLNNYGWIHRETGVVRIPIDHAKNLVIERGLPSRQK